MRYLTIIIQLLVPSAAAFAGFPDYTQSLTTNRRGYPIYSATTIPTETDAAQNFSTQGTLTLFSPCKINLFLRIIRKRPDGYHDLASLFQAIGFGDTLELTKLADATAQSDDFDCNMRGVPKDSTNLVLRALSLMREKTGVKQYYKANLIKQVPAQAGLGGGSANAATAMWAANELMGRPATLEQVSHCFLSLVHKWVISEIISKDRHL